MKVIAIYPGRFQPFGLHHDKTFKWLSSKFGEKNTFIVTSNKTDSGKSPFNFKEKQAIISQYGIPSKNIIQVRSPYKADELTQKFDPDNTAVVFMYGEKDAGRINYNKKDGSKGYFQKYDKSIELAPLNQHGYIITAPNISLNIPPFGEMSGTTLREFIKSSDPKSFEAVFGWYDSEIFNMMQSKLTGLSELSKFKNLTEKKGHILNVFDFDDTLAKTTAEIKVIHSDGEITMLDPGEYALYEPRPGDKFDFGEFGRMIKGATAIKSNIKKLMNSLKAHVGKTTILTARALAYPVKHWLKDKFNLDVYVVPLASGDPQKKADWIEKQIKRGTKIVNFYDDSIKNIKAVGKLATKYPDVIFNTKHIREELDEGIYLHEISNIKGKQSVDDGPRFFYGDVNSYKASLDDTSKRPIGWEVVNWIIGDLNTLEKYSTDWPNGPIPTVSFFPTGVSGNQNAGTRYYKELKELPAFRTWVDHIKKMSSLQGYELIDDLDPTQIVNSGLPVIVESMAIQIEAIDDLSDEERSKLKRLDHYLVQNEFEKRSEKDGITYLYYNINDDMGDFWDIYGEIEAFDTETGEKVGSVGFGRARSEDPLHGSMDVFSKYRRRGIATYMYDWAEKITGIELTPEKKNSPDAQAFWKSRKKAKGLTEGIFESITKNQLQRIEYYADKLFAAIGVDVDLSAKHFFQRLNDKRNSNDITQDELRSLLKATFIKHGGVIDGMDKGTEAVIKSMRSDINVPFVIVWDKENKEFDLVTKTIMRKRNFRTSNKVLQVENAHMLLEGGAAGHMNHPYDNKDFTFNDLMELIDRGLSGNLDIEGDVTEKLDGQNLMVTYKDGRLGAARNKTTIFNPMSLEDVANKFSGRGNITTAFVEAMRDLETALQSIGQDKLNKLFKDGHRFLNMEILFPATRNVIDYGQSAYIVLLGMVEFDDNAKPVKNLPSVAGRLQKIINRINADQQDTFTILGPKILKLATSDNFEEKSSSLKGDLKRIASSAGLSTSATLLDYSDAKIKNVIADNFDLDPSIVDLLVIRWSHGKKSIRLTKKLLGDDFEAVRDFEKFKLKSIIKDIQFPIETVMLRFGYELMLNIKDYLTVSPSSAVSSIRRELAGLISTAKVSNDPKVLQSLSVNLKKIKAIGGFKTILPTEGIVFNYKGRLIKLTGSFAPINQLLGLFKYTR